MVKHAEITVSEKVTIHVLIVLIGLSIQIELWYWLTFFSSCLISIALKYIFPNDRIFYPLSKEKKIIFTYTETGFYTENNKHINWSSVNRVIAYKEDLITVDCIHVNIELENDISFTVHEDLSMYNEFIEQLEENIEIKPTWFQEVAFPAFERNETVIYEKSKISFSQ